MTRRRFRTVPFAAALGAIFALGLALSATAYGQDGPAPRDEHAAHDPREGDHGDRDPGPRDEGDRPSAEEVRDAFEDGGAPARRGDAERRDRDGKRRPSFRDHRPDNRHSLSAEEIDERLEILRDVNPEMAERIERFRKQFPEQARLIARREFPMLERLRHLKANDPEGYEFTVADMRLEKESRNLAFQLRQARRDGSRDEVKRLRNELTKVVKEHFEVRHEKRVHELERLERKLETMRDRLEKREKMAEELIDQRIRDLAGDEPEPEF